MDQIQNDDFCSESFFLSTCCLFRNAHLCFRFQDPLSVYSLICNCWRKEKKNLRNTSSVSNNSFIPPTQWDCSVPAAITINLLFKWIAISNEPSNLLVKIRCLYGLKNHFWELRPSLSKGRRRNHLLNYECWSEDEVQTGSTGKSRTKKKTDLYEELNW